MPTYGPWEDGRIHEEIIHGKISADYDPPVEHELLSPAPTRPSGWNITLDGWVARGSVTWSHAGGLDDPPEPDADKSLTAFILAKGTAVLESGWALQYDMDSNGARHKISTVNEWSATHGWEFRGTEYRMGYEYLNDMDARYAIPPGMDNITDEYAVQLEPWVTDIPADITLLSAVVLGPGEVDNYGLYCKDAGDVDEPPFLNFGETSISNSQHNPAPYSLSTFQMKQIMEEIREEGSLDDPIVDISNNHPAMPRMSWLYKGPNLTDPHFDGSHEVSHAEGMPVAIKIRYQMPRWRQVFFDDEPLPVHYRRTYPRDDGLAGGAPRTFPPSMAEQSSNRVGGSYF